MSSRPDSAAGKDTSSSINFKAALSSSSKPNSNGVNSMANGKTGNMDSKSRPNRINSKKYQVFGQDDWVLGLGDDLNKDYAKCREDARRAAVARNKLLEEATRAYTSGDKPRANALSAQGKALNAELHRLHAQAATKIFQQRNPTARLKENKVDLHGLHVEESMVVFEGMSRTGTTELVSSLIYCMICIFKFIIHDAIRFSNILYAILIHL